MKCDDCQGRGVQWFTGAAWLCKRCWLERFGSRPPANGVKR